MESSCEDRGGSGTGDDGSFHVRYLRDLTRKEEEREGGREGGNEVRK